MPVKSRTLGKKLKPRMIEYIKEARQPTEGARRSEKSLNDADIFNLRLKHRQLHQKKKKKKALFGVQLKQT